MNLRIIATLVIFVALAQAKVQQQIQTEGIAIKLRSGACPKTRRILLRIKITGVITFNTKA